MVGLPGELNIEKLGEQMYQLSTELFPTCRSITGNGVRKSLHIIQTYIPIRVQEVPSGTPVFDWIIPKEWNIRDAYVKNTKGERLIDFNQSNLHVVDYSIPIKKKISFEELKTHLYTLPVVLEENNSGNIEI